MLYSGRRVSATMEHDPRHLNASSFDVEMIRCCDDEYLVTDDPEQPVKDISLQNVAVQPYLLEICRCTNVESLTLKGCFLIDIPKGWLIV